MTGKSASCDCGAETSGKWADIHGAGCASLTAAQNPWAHVPKQYAGRWSFDYEEKGGEGWFFVYCNGYSILRTEDSEVADAVCRAHNAWLD